MTKSPSSPWKRTKRQVWQDARRAYLEALKAGGGDMCVTVVRRDQVDDLMKQAKTDKMIARPCCYAINKAIVDICERVNSPKNRGMCLTCDHEFEQCDPGAFVVVIPRGDDQGTVCGASPVCIDCLNKYDARVLVEAGIDLAARIMNVRLERGPWQSTTN